MQQIQSIKRPTQRAQRNLHNLIENSRSLVGDESDWVREGPDLAALDRGPEYSWLHTFTVDFDQQILKKSYTSECQTLSPMTLCLPSHLLTPFHYHHTFHGVEI